MPPKLHLLVLLGKQVHRCNFDGQNKEWWELFPVHVIRRIDGGKVFQKIGNVF
jgi:hypothetical protein